MAFIAGSLIEQRSEPVDVLSGARRLWGCIVHSHALLGCADEAGAGTERDDTFPLPRKGHTWREAG